MRRPQNLLLLPDRRASNYHAIPPSVQGALLSDRRAEGGAGRGIRPHALRVELGARPSHAELLPQGFPAAKAKVSPTPTRRSNSPR
jgi:hypothetical protein